MGIVLTAAYCIGFGLLFGFAVWHERWYVAATMALLWPGVLLAALVQILWIFWELRK